MTAFVALYARPESSEANNAPEAPVACGQGLRGRMAPVFVPQTITQGCLPEICQNCATRSLTSPHHAAFSSTAHLGVCEETCGHARWYEPPEHQWHARGVRGSSPQLYHPVSACSADAWDWWPA